MKSLLENSELCGGIVGFELDGDEITTGNAMSRLLTKQELGLGSSSELSFLASGVRALDPHM